MEAQKAALKDIRETANDICYTVQQQGTQTTTTLSGDIQSKADGLIKQLVALDSLYQVNRTLQHIKA